MFHPHLGISYTTARDNSKRHVALFVEDIKRYGTHCIKSGTASNIGCRELNGDLIDKHAGWRNAKSKQRYIEYKTEDLLTISRRLGLGVYKH